LHAWGLCSSGTWGLVFFCRPDFDSLCVRLSPPRCFTCSLGLQGVQWAVGNSRDARKLARTPHANKKKKKDIQLLQFRIHHPSISSMNSATNSNIDISWWILNKTAFTMSVEEGTSSLLQSPTPSEFILIHSILNSISRSTVYYSDCFIFVILKNWLLILF